jgi:hypothetical protein
MDEESCWEACLFAGAAPDGFCALSVVVPPGVFEVEPVVWQPAERVATARRVVKAIVIS